MTKKYKTGSPPGTLVYTGDHDGKRVRITLIQFTESEYSEREFYDLSECISYTSKDKVNWIDVDGVHNQHLIEKIGQLYNIHPLTLEDLMHTDQRPKFEDYEHYLLSILKMITYKDVMREEQLSLVLLENTVISFQEPDGGDAFDTIRERLRQAKGRVRKRGADYLFYALMDSVIDWYFIVVDKISERVHEIETELLRDSTSASVLQLYKLKREIINLSKHVMPLRDLVHNMSKSENDLITEPSRLFHRDLADHVSRIIDSVHANRDTLNGLMDLYLSFNSLKMNEVMKVLTIMSSIFIPVTFVAGVYGMNFEYMPELRSPYGYAIVWLVMLLMMGGLLFYFRRKKWM
ncbi:MAG TPA: magnesium/cobalt transporter CorA [Bacteroidia bacterium]|nr:magnesium/cobalt transporter CorA [Bacteroidia bacterium]